MKALLAFFVTFSVFAGNKFAMEKQNTMKRLMAAKTDTTVVTCVKNAKNMEQMAACEKTPEQETMPAATNEQAKAPAAETTKAPATH